LYAPNNYDALAYRVPRVLHWLAEGRWHWIHTGFQRLNTRAPGFEWISAAVIAITRSDRLLFLINIVSFLLLPGLIFSFFRRLGIQRQVAWHWMWLLPTGYCFLLQAASIGNDLFGAVFALASIDLALRARESQRAAEVWLSILAAALMTASKASNLPLLLPWLIAIAPAIRCIFQQLPATIAVAGVALLSSLLPQMWLNTKFAGEWTGVRAENGQIMEGHPILKLANNLVLTTLQNLVPPLFPSANNWNLQVKRTLPIQWQNRLEQTFEPAGAHWALNQMESEEYAGLGLGISALILASFGAGLKLAHVTRPRPERKDVMISQAAGEEIGNRRIRNLFVRAVVCGSALALLVFMAKSGMSTIARLITPYYLLCIPSLLWGLNQAQLIRMKWWRRFAMGVFGLAAVPLILSPSRPLWPAAIVLAHDTATGIVSRARTVYTVYGERADAFAPVRKILPPGLQVLGLISFDDPETSLWKPYISLRIEHLVNTDSAQSIQDRGIEYVLVNPEKLQMLFDKTFEKWLTDMNGKVVNRIPLRLRASSGPIDWFLVRLPPTSDK